MYAGIGVVVALVHVDVAVGSLEARLAGAPVVVAQGGAGGAVPAGLGGAVVLLSAVLASPAERTGAGEGVERGEVAGPSVTAGRRVTHVLHWGLAQGVGEAQGTGAGEGGDPASVLVDHTAPSVLADLLPGAAGVEVLAVVSNILRRAPVKARGVRGASCVKYSNDKCWPSVDRESSLDGGRWFDWDQWPG